MPPRANEPPRRGPQPRRGAPRPTEPVEPADGDAPVDGRGRAFDGIGDARAYTPRGRTVREKGDRGSAPRTGRGDPFRPALHLLDGGQSTARDRRRPVEEPPTAPTRGARGERPSTPPRAAAQRPAAVGPAAGSTQGDRATESARRRRQAAEPEPGRRQTGQAEPRSRPTVGGRTDDAGRTRDAARDRDGTAPRRGPARPPARPARRIVVAEPPPLAEAGRRLRLGSLLALSLFAVIGIRLVSVQLFESPAYAHSLLEQRNSRLTSVKLPAPRGSILDRNGAVLAHSIEARYIFADPTLVEDPAEVAARLSPLLGIAPSRLEQRMARKARPGGGESQFEFLARGVDVSVADRIAAMKLQGIGQDRDERREVLSRDVAANLIGFTGGEHNGLEGLEARFNALLRGQDGKRVFTRGNPAGDAELDQEIPGGYTKETPAQPGSTLVLTIDRDLQYEVQRILNAELTRVDATIGAAVIIDVRTGEVLAQASFPFYDAAKPADAKPADRDDVATSVIADPGSTHKAFIFGAALQEGIITADSTLQVGPALRRGGVSFKDTHPHPKGTTVTMPGLLAYSSNVGTILLADKLTPQKVYEYQQKFGLGAATGEGMPGEAPGRLLAPSEWSPSGSGSIPLGHSVDATLIQMAAGYATIANDGTYIQPHLIKNTVGPDGTVRPEPAPKTHEVLSPGNAAALRTMMEAVVDVPGATGNLARVPGYRVAGKTGTGSRLVNGKYTSYQAGSFIGMAPADNPRYVVAVFADTPSGSGGVVAGPAFSKMMTRTLAHYHVPFSASRPPTFTIVP